MYTCFSKGKLSPLQEHLPGNVFHQEPAQIATVGVDSSTSTLEMQLCQSLLKLILLNRVDVD